MLYAEFHGHPEPVNNVGDLMFYRKATGATERGTLVAPFTGIDGWICATTRKRRSSCA